MIDEQIEKQSIIKKYSDEEMKKFIDNLGKKADEIMIKALEGAKEEEKINHPAHYASQCKCSMCGHEIECIDIVAHMGFSLGNVIKYIWRHQHKDGLEGLKKAQWYLNDYIKRIEENE